MAREISESRKTAFYLGTLLIVVGIIVFVSVFVSQAADFGDFTDFERKASSSMVRGLIGMGLIVAGSLIRRVGARGAAGSGMILDPGQARKDLEPYSRMAGGMVKDALGEADIDLTVKATQRGGGGEEAIKVRCRSCRTLNDEDARFCDQCGEPV